MTHVYVSADVEGVSGYVDPEEDGQPETRRAMTRDVNAAIEGVLDAAPEATVTVTDAHGDKRTISPSDLHERASLVRGGPRPDGMIDGASADADVACLVGYHDRPGSGGHLEHVFTGSITSIRVDDDPVGELELNAAFLAAMDVPVALVTGDDVLSETVADVLPSARYVTTKTARGAGAAACRDPASVRADVRDAAANALANPPTQPDPSVVLDPPIAIAVEYVTAKHADVASLWPAVERGAHSRTVRYDAPSVEAAYRFARAASTVSI